MNALTHEFGWCHYSVNQSVWHILGSDIFHFCFSTVHVCLICLLNCNNSVESFSFFTLVAPRSLKTGVFVCAVEGVCTVDS